MATDSHINITFTADGREVDLRIPAKISVYRLIRELAQIFPGLDAGLVKYQLRVPTKGILLTEEDVISAYPVSSGDVLELCAGGFHG